jgi:GNAT superfamily N-acetyltransferase
MNLRIKSLWECSSQDFTDFLQRLDFGHAPHWAGCYCRFYHHDEDFDDWKNRLPIENRREAIDCIEHKQMHGFLAFDDEQCIGWLNANDVKTFVRLKNLIPDFIKDKKAAMTICYVIDPQYRNQKAATSLLQEAIRHYRSLGYDGMLAAPFETDGDFALKYRGTPGMYEKLGYTMIDRMDRLSVYWLDFHKVDQNIM